LKAIEKRELAGFITPLERYVWSIEAGQSSMGSLQLWIASSSAAFSITRLPARAGDF
jgi:ribulose kinase